MAGEQHATLEADGTTRDWQPFYGSTVTPPPPPPPPPPPGGAPIFGFNTSDATRDIKIGWFTKVNCGRGYYGFGDLPITGNGFRAGGKEFKLAGLDNAAAVSAKRINISSRFNPGDINSASSERVLNTVAYVKTIPVGWTVYICHHEYNKNTLSPAQYVQMLTGFKFLSAAVYAQSTAQVAAGTGGRAIYVVNAGDSGLGNTPDLSIVPDASTMAPDYQFWTDTYFNPNGNPAGYKAYGSAYPGWQNVMVNAYDIAEAIGCHNNSDGGTRGHGYGEINAPRRVAPKLATLNTTLGWGPLSPFDIDGSGQAQCISDACSFAAGTLDPTRTTPAKVFLLWHADTGTWNQRFDTGGKAGAGLDDGTAASPGPHYQGFPIATDPTKPKNIYKTYVNLSA